LAVVTEEVVPVHVPRSDERDSLESAG
jgi:hypothetical protein